MPNWELEQKSYSGWYSRINLITPKGHYLSLNYVMNEVNDEKGEWVRDEYSDKHKEAYAELEHMVEVMNREEFGRHGFPSNSEPLPDDEASKLMEAAEGSPKITFYREMEEVPNG